jgi:hypothetical protein
VSGVARRALSRLIHLPQYAVALGICYAPWASAYKRRLLAVEPASAWDRYWRRYLLPIWHRMEFNRSAPAEQERLKADVVFGGANGVRWAQGYDAVPFEDLLAGRVGRLPYRDACPIWSELERLCGQSREWTVVQIGSSSGRELAYYAGRYPAIEFVGVDIVPEVVRYAAAAHRAPNLRFVAADAKHLRLALESQIQRPIVMLSVGTLQYIGASFIGQWFQDMSGWFSVRHLLIQEGVLLTHGPPDRLQGSFNAQSWTSTHDYGWYAEAAGWQTRAKAVIAPYDPPREYPEHADVAHYFYYGVRADPGSAMNSRQGSRA